MRNREAFKALCLIFQVFIKSMVATPLYSNGLYEHWDPGTNKVLFCREVLVKQGFEAVPCTENEAEDSIRKCQIGQYQPDETNSSSSPKCIAEPQCTDEGIKKDSKCIDGYCWTVCICSLELGKCGLDPSNCLDIKDIRCIGKVLQDCSCAPPVNTTTLMTSPPTRSSSSTIFKTINPIWTAKTLLPKPTDTTKNTDKIGTTKDGTDTEAKGNEVGILLPIIIIISILVTLVVSYLCVKFRKHRSNRPIGDHRQSSELTESDPADRNSGLDADKVSEAADSGVCGLSQGSNENHEPGEADSNSINLSNRSDMETGRNMDITVGHESGRNLDIAVGHESGRNLDIAVGHDSDDEAAQGPSQSLCQVYIHKDSKLREEPTLAEEEDSCQESDPFLSPDDYADDACTRDLSQQSDENCESGETNPNNNLINGSDDPDATHCKSTSISYHGTNLHHTDGNDAARQVTDLDPALSLCHFEVQKEPRQREKPTIVVEMEDGSPDKKSLQEKKVAVVSPFNEVQTVPVQDSPPAHNAENQPLRGEGYPSDSGFNYGGAAANLSMNWISFGSSLYRESTNQ